MSVTAPPVVRMRVRVQGTVQGELLGVIPARPPLQDDGSGADHRMILRARSESSASWRMASPSASLRRSFT